MALIKPTNFVNLGLLEKVKMATGTLKSVSVTDVDVVKPALTSEMSIVEVDLTKGVDIKAYKYIALAGVVVTGEWTIPDGCNGYVRIIISDRRMLSSAEAVLGVYEAKAKKGRFQFAVRPNYFITQKDALKKPWDVVVYINGINIDKDSDPLVLEFVSVCKQSNSIVLKGLKDRLIQAINVDPNFKLDEDDVDEFVDRIAAFDRLKRARMLRSSSFVDKSFVKKKSVKSGGKNVRGGTANIGLESTFHTKNNLKKNELPSVKSFSAPVSSGSMGGVRKLFDTSEESKGATVPDATSPSESLGPFQYLFEGTDEEREVPGW
uniref:Movement protein n=1 Tax=Jand tobamovirus 1 TaxID=3238876 RepID=A0AB39BZK6_9VIRU